jgi:TPR repeat protein
MMPSSRKDGAKGGAVPGRTALQRGGANMAHIDLAGLTGGNQDQSGTGDLLYALGMMSAAGSSADVDLVAAHKWFNLAAMRGHAEAARLRREIATEMSESEIAMAQRAARDWLRRGENMPVSPRVMLERAYGSEASNDSSYERIEEASALRVAA